MIKFPFTSVRTPGYGASVKLPKLNPLNANGFPFWSVKTNGVGFPSFTPVRPEVIVIVLPLLVNTIGGRIGSPVELHRTIGVG